MQKLFFAAIGAAALVSVPALAQTSGSGTTTGSNANGANSTMSANPRANGGASGTTTGSNGANSGMSANSGANGGASGTTQMSQNDMSKLQQRIMTDLQSNGYRNVRVVPNSFLIHAENKSGEPVVMIINPDFVFAMTDVGTAGQASPNGAGGNNSNLGGNPAATGNTTKQ